MAYASDIMLTFGAQRPVSRRFILLLLVVLVLFLPTKILQPSHMVCPTSPESLKPKTGGFDLWLLEQQERRARIARVCSSSSRRRRGAPIKTRSVDRLMFHFNEEHRLLFCYQPKVG